ncbi:peptidoglycan-binding protein [Candidatus Poribacteria bacterium]|nr:peptidoglycan-binding protein [Candidatus Poribacteria bacterium]
MIDWNWLARECLFDVIGAHPLSCLGYPPDIETMHDWAIIADAYKKRIVANEAGSWYVSQMNKEGWYVVRDIVLECKKYDYEACCIVSIDTNSLDHPLGFRRWNRNYTNLVAQSPYWGDFISLVNKEGKKYKHGIGDDDMLLEKYYYKNKVTYTRDPKKYGVKFIQLCFGLSPTGVFDTALDNAVKTYQYINCPPADGIVGPITFDNLRDKNSEKYINVHSLWARGM